MPTSFTVNKSCIEWIECMTDLRDGGNDKQNKHNRSRWEWGWHFWPHKLTLSLYLFLLRFVFDNIVFCKWIRIIKKWELGKFFFGLNLISVFNGIVHVIYFVLVYYSIHMLYYCPCPLPLLFIMQRMQSYTYSDNVSIPLWIQFNQPTNHFNFFQVFFQFSRLPNKIQSH